MVSEDPATNQLSLVVETLPKDVLPPGLTRHVDVFLQTMKWKQHTHAWSD